MNQYRDDQGIEPVIFDAGDAFFASPVLAKSNAEGDILQARGLLQGYEIVGCDVLNVGGFDFAAGKDLLLEMSAQASFPFISANLTDIDDNLLFEPYTIVESYGFKIGVVGVSNHVPDHIIDVKKRDLISAANSVIEEISPNVDFIVLLANVQRKQSKNLAKNFPGADYIFFSRDIQRTRAEVTQAEHGPYVYGSGNQGKYLTVVEIALHDPKEPIVDISVAKGKINSIKKRLKKLQKKDPYRSIEEIYADKPNVIKLVTDYRQQLTENEKIMASAINTTKYESIPLSKKLGEDNKLLAFVDETLAICNALRKKSTKISKDIIKPKTGPIKKTININ